MKQLLPVLFFLIALTVAAQKPVSPKKAYKPIRTALKAKKANDALSAIRKLVADSAYNTDPKLYAYGIDAELLLCEGFNEKMYLKQQIDTAQFFTANYDLCQFILRCDTAEQRQFDKTISDSLTLAALKQDGGPYRKQNRQILLQYYPNLSAAGRFHYAKRQYAEARKYFSLYFNLPSHPLWGKDISVLTSKTYQENCYLDFRSMYELHQYDQMPNYERLLNDSLLHTQVLDLLIHAARERKDSTEYLRLVGQGLREQPSRLDYFAILANNHTEHGDYEAAIALSDSLLARDPMNYYYLECRCLSLFKLGRLDESKIAAQRLFDVDSTSIEANYVLGYYYVDKAERVELPRQTRSNLYKAAKLRQTENFQQARPYMERFRRLIPEETDRWLPLLYKIYLNLNLGKEFEEIERIKATTQ